MKVSSIIDLSLTELSPAKWWSLVSWEGSLLTFMVLFTMSWAGPLLLVMEFCARASPASHFNPFSPWVWNFCWFQWANNEDRQVLLAHPKLRESDPTEKGSSHHIKAKSFEPQHYPFRDLKHEPFLRATPELNGVTRMQNAQSHTPVPWLTCQKGTTYIWKELEKRKGAALQPLSLQSPRALGMISSSIKSRFDSWRRIQKYDSTHEHLYVWQSCLKGSRWGLGHPSPALAGCARVSCKIFQQTAIALAFTSSACFPMRKDSRQSRQPCTEH